MHKAQALLLPAMALLTLSLGCLRSYNTSPLSPASLNTTLKNPAGLALQTKAFLAPAEVAEKFGKKLAEDRQMLLPDEVIDQVIPVQVLLANHGTSSYKVLRSGFALVGSQPGRVPQLTPEEIYQLGRHGYGAPVCGIFFGGPLGVPSLVTTIVANNNLREDYEAKELKDAILAPGKEVAGTVFFDPLPQHMNRADPFRLVVELLDAETNAKVTLEQALVQN